MDIRWLQRFENYTKAMNQLSEFVAHEPLNKFEVQGLIQCFEYSFELGWKTMKDYLEYEGHEVKSPRETIQKALQNGLIEDGHTWMDALNKRNLMAHTYDEAVAEEAHQLIKNNYYFVLKDLKDYLEERKAHIDRVGIVIFDRFATANIQSCNKIKSDIK